MTTEQEKALIEAVRLLLRNIQQSSRIEARRVDKEHSFADYPINDRIRELIGDADYCGEMLARL